MTGRRKGKPAAVVAEDEKGDLRVDQIKIGHFYEMERVEPSDKKGRNPMEFEIVRRVGSRNILAVYESSTSPFARNDNS